MANAAYMRIVHEVHDTRVYMWTLRMLKLDIRLDTQQVLQYRGQGVVELLNHRLPSDEHVELGQEELDNLWR